MLTIEEASLAPVDVLLSNYKEAVWELNALLGRDGILQQEWLDPERRLPASVSELGGKFRVICIPRGKSSTRGPESKPFSEHSPAQQTEIRSVS